MKFKESILEVVANDYLTPNQMADLLSQMFCDYHINYAQRMNSMTGVDRDFFLQNIREEWFPEFNNEELQKAIEKIR